jgi:hypothetical protein
VECLGRRQATLDRKSMALRHRETDDSAGQRISMAGTIAA